MLNVPLKSRGGSVRGLARTSKQQVEQLLEIAASTGLPPAQRDPDMLASMKVPQIGSGPRTADATVRRLTRVERLLRMKVLEPHEAQACEWYANCAALAWDTTGCTANYEGSSGGGGAHAPDRLMAKRQEVAWARDDYREARALLGGKMADAFEAIVCRNEALGPTAAAAFPDLQRSAAGDRLRTTVRFCANILHTRFAGQMGWYQAPVVPAKAVVATVRWESPTPKGLVKASIPTPTPKVVADVIEALAKLSTPSEVQLWVAPDVHAILARSVTRGTAQLRDINGTPLVIKENWRYGWVIVPA